MTKGKYKARAANREVARDNELIVEKIEEIAALKQKLIDIERELAKERAERGALVVTRAGELSAGQIAVLHNQMIQMQEEHDDEKEDIADWLTQWIYDVQEQNPDIKLMPIGFEEKIAQLVGNEKVGGYLSKMVFEARGTSNRRRRRITPKKVKGLYENNLQDMAFNNENPALVKGGVGVREAVENNTLHPPRNSSIAL